MLGMFIYNLSLYMENIVYYEYVCILFVVVYLNIFREFRFEWDYYILL